MPKETIKRPENSIQAAPIDGLDGSPPSTGFIEQRLGLAVGWNDIGWVQVYMEPHDAESTGDWHIVDLERTDINRLIRALRKARDRAYGVDA